MAEKFNPLYKLLKAETPISITSELNETFDSLNEAISDASELALKRRLPWNKIVPVIYARFKSAGLDLIEDKPEQKVQPKKKNYVPVAFGSQIFPPAQLKMSIYSKDSWAVYVESLDFAHIFWEALKQTNVLTDSKSFTRFF